MKTKLLKKLRKQGRQQITIYSVTTEGGTVIGMSYGYSDKKYSNSFGFGDTEEQVLRKAEKIYIRDFLEKKRSR